MLGMSENRNKIGAGRGNKAPAGTKAVSRSVAFAPAILVELDRYAEERGINRSEALREIIPAGIAALRKKQG